MKKHKLFAYIAAPVVGIGLLGAAGIASAQGLGFKMGIDATPEVVAEKHQQMFEKQAELLGISIDEIKAAWATGKSLQKLAEEKGISQETIKAKMDAQRKAKMQASLNALVSKGVITQAQADSRLKYIANVPKGREGKAGRGGMMHGTMHGGFGF